MSMRSALTENSRNSSIRSMPMVSAARACLMFSSTPQSVDPATSRASGLGGQQVEGVGQAAGRT